MKLMRIKEYLPILLLGIVLFIVGAITDKATSQMLYNDFGVWGFGVILSDIVLVFFFFVCYTTVIAGLVALFKKENENPTWMKIVFGILFILGGLFLVYQSFNNLQDIKILVGDTAAKVVSIILVVVIALASYFVARYIILNFEHKNILRSAIIMLSIVVIANALMIAFKYLWSRPRPWYIYGLSNIVPSHLDSFKAVYEANPFMAFQMPEKEYFKSFPSNHTNNSVMVMSALLLYSNIDPRWNKERARIWIIGGGLIFTLITAFARIIAGAHFLSDVSFGLILGFTVTYVTFVIANKIFPEENKEVDEE